MVKMEQILKLSEIIPYENNARKNDKAVKDVAESIKQCGYIAPIIVDENNIILAGHTRYKALKKLGYKEVTVRKVTGLTEEQKRKYRLLDNKTNELAEWDFEKLKDEIYGLDFSEFDIDWGIEEDTETVSVIEDTPLETDNTREPITKFGDVYQLGEHRLMCGDSTDKAMVEILMNGVKADIILSDPPYGMHLDTDFSGAVGSLGRRGGQEGTRGNKYDKVIGDNEDFNPKLINTFFDNFSCKEIFLFGADYYAELLPNKNEGSWLVWDKRKESQADAIGSEFELIWSKNKHKRRMLRHDWFGFLSSQNAKDAQHRVHPTQKPVTLLADIINQWGEGLDVVVDLYGGSGSTLIACEQLNRKCYCMELDPKYCDVIIKRWETFTGKKAIKLK